MDIFAGICVIAAAIGYILIDHQQWNKMCRERNAYLAVLIGMEFQNIEGIGRMDYEKALKLGVTAAQRIQAQRELCDNYHTIRSSTS